MNPAGRRCTGTGYRLLQHNDGKAIDDVLDLDGTRSSDLHT